MYPTYAVGHEMKLIFNIDGVPVYKSSNIQCWPILCSVDNLEPFIVAIFYGNSKPSSIDDYLSDLVSELLNIREDGIRINDEVVDIQIKVFVCDAPARAFLKCIKGHTANHSCERCQIRGEYYERRVTYRLPEEDDDLPLLRSDVEFSRMEYPEHQIARSPLLDAGISCISKFPLDYMHLVCLGVVKRILVFLRDGPRACKLSKQQFRRISDRLSSFNGKMPRKFARQPRPITEMEHWKATEFRQFLLYTGPIVLSGIVTDKIFDHFMVLNVAISVLLLSKSDLRNEYVQCTRELLVYFIREAASIYGNTFITYNVHGLSHIADDVVFYNSSLNEISAFTFENYLQKLKKNVRNAKNPISQVAKRETEMEKNLKRRHLKPKYT
ncbi:uncharacterized protein LOC132758638 [Ruditapes philippinarum]|uniref:uncharacterized protein LOC132758638 n=1 Tax=Ruditapes philippinarum TaxID=129788 RepID=UPI00295BABE7|nr:uncharacterized protein LOC132758638 [Ruditapes philippinarum]